ncbi:UDP-4-amino-4,6-dideoxy-N-acetyl-beta-L-altrosamine N-acetyltransferase [Campylobacter coli]
MLWGGGKALILILQNYTHLSNKIKEKLRLYRNHLGVKKYLYTTHYISKQEHKKFIQKLKKTNKKSYFCVSCNKQILGSVNFFTINKAVEFGFYANPYSHLNGLGRILEQIIIYYSFNILYCSDIYLEAFQENSQIINLHKKFGFKEICFKNKKIIKMKLNIKGLYNERN